MHDPLTVAFEIRQPWPKRDRSYDTKPAPAGTRLRSRWAWHLPFVRLAGRGWYFANLITVWHREPGGHDAGTVCKRWQRRRPATGRTRHVTRVAWYLHIHHWHLQLHPYQQLRRRLLTRCEWCGSRSRKGDPVDVSNGAYREKTKWWRGEEGLYHGDCSSVAGARGLCLCADPLLRYGTYGQCFECGKHRSYGMEIDDGHRVLAALPAGSRIPAEVKAFLDPIYAERRARIETEA
jgi:hypothetical protein